MERGRGRGRGIVSSVPGACAGRELAALVATLEAALGRVREARALSPKVRSYAEYVATMGRALDEIAETVLAARERVQRMRRRAPLH